MTEQGVGLGDLAVDTDPASFVEVMFAKCSEEAKACCALLEEHTIPARMERRTASTALGVAVLVPDTQLIEASEVLILRAEDDDEGGDDDFDDDMEEGDDEDDDDLDYDDDEEEDGDDEEDDYDDSDDES